MIWKEEKGISGQGRSRINMRKRQVLLISHSQHLQPNPALPTFELVNSSAVVSMIVWFTLKFFSSVCNFCFSSLPRIYSLIKYLINHLDINVGSGLDCFLNLFLVKKKSSISLYLCIILLSFLGSPLISLMLCSFSDSSGIPEGSILSPLLFFSFTKDRPSPHLP